MSPGESVKNGLLPCAAETMTRSAVIRTVTLAPIVPNRTAAQAMNGSRKVRGTRTAPGMNVYLASANGMANHVVSNPAPSAVHSSMRRRGGQGSSEVR